MNIVDIAAGSEDFNILVTALETAGLVDTVRDADNITVFAPTDAAFTALAVDLGFDGDTSDEGAVFGHIAGALAGLAEDDDPIPLLTDILLYHVAPGERTEPTILGSEGIATLLEGAEIAPADGALGDLEPDLTDPTIVVPDIEADNGIIQGIDRVLLPIDIPGNTMEEAPPQNIVEIATGSEDFNILVSALTTAGLVETIRDSDDITVFAPTDAAFTDLAVDLGFDGDTSDEDAVFGHIAGALTDLGGGDPIPLLTDILLYHVSGGAKSQAEITAAGSVATLLTDAEITPSGGTLVDGEPDLLDPTIVVPDVAAANGTIQGIDKVLLPIDIAGNDRDTITGIVAASGGAFDDNAADFDLLLNALQAAGLTGALNNPDSNLTVFAPNDAAFVAAAQALGFDGTDEAGAFDYIVQAVTLLSFGNDPVPLLSDILLYHVAPGALDAEAVLGSDTIDTLLGFDLAVDGAALVDGEPDLPNANIIETNIAASNGFVHAIDGVLIPVDLLPSDGQDDVAFVIGDDTSETFTLGDNNDYVSAGGGDDTITGGPGDDVIVGGDGEDTAVVTGDLNDFGFAFGPGGIAQTDKANGDTGTDILNDVEFVQFDDGRLNLSVLDGAVNLSPDQLQLLTELYVAYFDRAPDAGGLLFWGTSLNNGVTLPEIAALFFDQPETQAKMPADLSSGEFVDLAYRNFLERDPDQPGKDFWVSNLEAGTVSRPEFMLALIEGARADTGSPDDVRTIEDKGDIGVSFALINGLNNVDDAEAVMAAYMLDDRAAALAEAQSLIAEAADDANGVGGGETEFTFQLVGVIDDPFAVA
ncbi:fasciclin domain-containing protein [Marivita sp. S6314]|uniref:fasciclin domain-containing protein n=1 Tax=Marivita sp. S6314 TaxID=2926406 RepID=UPI001FF13FE1|nr:fasciclin domain-containing protein [Marivita sp. S6314]MCK0152037.1 fasciclin domain-containing protein [Marivita sp. S6314]